MKTAIAVTAALAMLALGVGGGYYAASRTRSAAAPEPTAATASAPADAPRPARSIRYYRNPMGLADTSSTPKKDPMGMDYVPVYDGDDEPADAGSIRISVDRVQKLGVRTEAAALRPLERTLRALGRIEIDERRVVTVAPRFEGWVERLHVNATGQPVARGQPLFDIYSPELVAAQREYMIARDGLVALKDAGAESQAGMARLADSALARLRSWGVSEDDVKALARSGELQRTLTLRAPASGIVLEKKAVQGMRFMPGEPLYQIVDLSTVWVIADVPEQDIADARPGAPATLTVDAYPGRAFDGRISYVYPTLKPETRTVPVRIELANPGGLLKPAMYAEVMWSVGGERSVLTVPASAVIDSGRRHVAFVQLTEGRYQPRDVKVGRRGNDRVEILAGITEGEPVVVAANFLIDAESNLKAAIGSFGVPASPAPPVATGHRAQGTVVAVDARTGTLTVKHGPVPSLKWPGMTMDFVAANPALVARLPSGTNFEFEFVERKPGEWVITSILPAGAAAATPAGR